MLTEKKRNIIAVIPARNEADMIKATIQSVAAQTTMVERIVVIANNCTDNTAEASRESGAEVLEMTENEHMKSGALNYALEQLIPNLHDEDCILVMDADTNLSEDLVEKCLQKFDDNPNAGAVGSIFTGRPSRSLLGRLQLMEYWRYRRQIHRNGNRAFVLSGTASVFLVKTLKAVKEGRNDGRLPNGGGGFYDICGRTEDNEITLAILKLGYDCPVADVFSVTDVMEKPKKLVRQRERWYNGALVNLKAYGRSLPWYMRFIYWKQQIGLFFSLIVFLMITTLLTISPFTNGGISVTKWWLVPLGILAIERTITVWSLGWRARLIALSIIPEQIYSIFLLLIYGQALINFAIGKRGKWHAT